MEFIVPSLIISCVIGIVRYLTLAILSEFHLLADLPNILYKEHHIVIQREVFPRKLSSVRLAVQWRGDNNTVATCNFS